MDHEGRRRGAMGEGGSDGGQVGEVEPGDLAVDAGKRCWQFRLGDAGTNPLLSFEQGAHERVAEEPGRAGDDPKQVGGEITHG